MRLKGGSKTRGSPQQASEILVCKLIMLSLNRNNSGLLMFEKN